MLKVLWIKNVNNKINQMRSKFLNKIGIILKSSSSKRIDPGSWLTISFYPLSRKHFKTLNLYIVLSKDLLIEFEV